ncbi:hypothetical protein BS78_04G167000 [Paspalum vaginatum]|nr:hypothetical protein BS78_04G167000 [Paspalum vaginatum]
MLIPVQSAPAPPLSSLHSLSSHYFLLPAHFLPPGGVRPPLRRGDLAIRMGGGPRTFPGGVSKWQWKRMQAKKARQLLKARLARERQLYEMRKRAELRDAVAHLERPWDPDSSADASAVAPNLLSVAADDQLKALADRFHRPGGVDLWNDRDGPRVFASPATGAASARFFPKNAVYSIQPYALASDGGEASAPRARGNALDPLLLGRGDGGTQGVRENAAEKEAYGCIADGEPAVELMERDGTWEPVNALGDADDSTAGDWTSDGDDDGSVVTSESEGTGDVGTWHERRAMVRRDGTREGHAMVRRDGRINGVARREAAGAMAAGRNGDRGWNGGSEQARDGHPGRRWQERSSGASPRKLAGGRWGDSKTAASAHVSQRGRTGAGSFSDSEVIRGGSEPKWRTRNRDDMKNGAGRADAPRKEWMGDGFDSDSDSARGRKLEPRWGARNKLNGRGHSEGRSKPKYSADASDGRRQFSGGFAEDLDVPTWKPRRMDRSRNSNGGRDDNNMGGGYRRGDNGGAGRIRANPRNNREDGGHSTRRNTGRQNWGDEYSLRPTSELRGSWSGKGFDGL